MAKNATRKVVVGEVRFSYAHVFEPWGDTDPKYSVVAVINKKDTHIIEEIKRAIQEVYDEEKRAMFKGRAIGSLALPLKDGDNPGEGREPNPSYEGSYYISANSKTAPGVVGRDRKPIINQDDFYSGCYGYISLTIAPYDINGKKGIKAYLNHIMKTRDGERLGGASTAEFDFADVPIVAEDVNDLF